MFYNILKGVLVEKYIHTLCIYNISTIVARPHPYLENSGYYCLKQSERYYGLLHQQQTYYTQHATLGSLTLFVCIPILLLQQQYYYYQISYIDYAYANIYGIFIGWQTISDSRDIAYIQPIYISYRIHKYVFINLGTTLLTYKIILKYVCYYFKND